MSNRNEAIAGIQPTRAAGLRTFVVEVFEQPSPDMPPGRLQAMIVKTLADAGFSRVSVSNYSAAAFDLMVKERNESIVYGNELVRVVEEQSRRIKHARELLDREMTDEEAATSPRVIKFYDGVIGKVSDYLAEPFFPPAGDS